MHRTLNRFLSMFGFRLAVTSCDARRWLHVRTNSGRYSPGLRIR